MDEGDVPNIVAAAVKGLKQAESYQVVGRVSVLPVGRRDSSPPWLASLPAKRIRPKKPTSMIYLHQVDSNARQWIHSATKGVIDE